MGKPEEEHEVLRPIVEEIRTTQTTTTTTVGSKEIIPVNKIKVPEEATAALLGFYRCIRSLGGKILPYLAASLHDGLFWTDNFIASEFYASSENLEEAHMCHAPKNLNFVKIAVTPLCLKALDLYHKGGVNLSYGKDRLRMLRHWKPERMNCYRNDSTLQAHFSKAIIQGEH
ncbi:hypothetical protein NQ317_009788 [Molorchus minor]|uniref:Uncharacterized protein n=1 Tax=Molorchus minor TaxID=1323400 RepID=A0ABQ9IS22_9CUCU|nr:hypothetical protein NQ317_009788 [Molorchus minor]